MGKLTISIAIFNSYVKFAEGTVFGGEIDYEWSWTGKNPLLFRSEASTQTSLSARSQQLGTQVFVQKLGSTNQTKVPDSESLLMRGAHIMHKTYQKISKQMVVWCFVVVSSNLVDSGIAWCWLSEQQKWDSPNLGWCHCNFLGKSQKTVERTRFSEKYGSSKISLKASRDCSWMPLPMVGSVGSVGSPGISMV